MRSDHPVYNNSNYTHSEITMETISSVTHTLERHIHWPQVNVFTSQKRSVQATIINCMNLCTCTYMWHYSSMCVNVNTPLNGRCKMFEKHTWPIDITTSGWAAHACNTWVDYVHVSATCTEICPEFFMWCLFSILDSLLIQYTHLPFYSLHIHYNYIGTYDLRGVYFYAAHAQQLGYTV